MHQAFSDLTWDAIRGQHQKNWDVLKNSYGLIPPSGFKERSLAEIARDCVYTCSKYLCSQTGPNAPPYCFSSLVDHLLVTFAYHFFCDNLEPKHLTKYLKILFDCTYLRNESQDQEENFLSNRRKQYRKWIQEITNIQKHCQCDLDASISSPISLSPDTALLPPNWFFSLTFSGSGIMSPFKIGSDAFHFVTFMEKKAKNPNLTLIEKLTNFLVKSDFIPLLIKQETRNTSMVYTSYVPRTQHIEPPLILELREAISISASKEHEKHYVTHWDDSGNLIKIKSQYIPYEVVSRPFTALPWQKDPYITTTPLPAQSYSPKNKCCSHDIIIDQELQLLFNSYLVECNYHGHAIAKILNCLFRHPPGENNPRNNRAYLALLTMVPRIRAPISHAAFIEFIDNVISRRLSDLESSSFGNAILKWGNQFIDQLNKEGLPVLEEFFLWSVCEQISSAEQVFLEIKRCFFPGGEFYREDLLFYRLLPQESCQSLSNKYKDLRRTSSTKQTKELDNMIDCLDTAAVGTFLSAINLYCTQIEIGLSGELNLPRDPADQATIFD